MDKEQLAKLKELRSEIQIQESNLSLALCQEALEKNAYDLSLARQWLKEKAKSFPSQETFVPKRQLGIVNIKEKNQKIIAFLLSYSDSSMPFDSQIFRQAIEKIEDILWANFPAFEQETNFIYSSKIQDLLNELAFLTKDKGINLKNCRFFWQKEREKLGIYLHHNRQKGALVLLKGGDEETAHELALQVVANQPQFLTRESVPLTVWEQEKERITNQIQEEKPLKKPEIREKILQGRLEKYLASHCFLEQSNFRDPKQKIKDYLAEKQVEIREFYFLTVT